MSTRSETRTFGRCLIVATMAFGLLTFTIPMPQTSAVSIVVLNPSDGSTVCPTYFIGVNTQGGVWNASTLTCTLVGNPKSSPNLCVSSSGSGCALYSIDELVIGTGVTFVMVNSTGMAVYSRLENNGSIVADITNYGTIINYGTINITHSDQLANLPYNGLGVIDNMQGSTINNYNWLTNAANISNYGTINNYGQFVSQDCCPIVNGTLFNNGTYTGSAPAPIVSNSVSLVGGNGSADQSSTTGITVAISGASGTNVIVSTQVEGATPPSGLGPAGLSGSEYFDILVSGVSGGEAHVCITNNAVSSSFTGVEYWNRTSWVEASDPVVSQGTPPTVCGGIPLSVLGGTPIAVGTLASTHSTSTTLSTSPTTVSAKNSAASSAVGSSSSNKASDNSSYLTVAFVLAVVLVSVLFVRIRKRGVSNNNVSAVAQK